MTTFFASLVVLASCSALAQQVQTLGRWVPYSAKYTETVSLRNSDSTGWRTNQTLIIEWRSLSGTVLTIQEVGFPPTEKSGKLWQANGQMFSLDYVSKRAIPAGKSPRRHPYVPPDAALGTMTIAGIQCTLYPLHGEGTGTICVDMDKDILCRMELRTDIVGVHQDYIKELTWIDLTTPVDDSVLKVPAEFTKSVSPK